MRLEKEAQRVLETMQKLVNGTDATGMGKRFLPQDALLGHTGFAFIHSKKGAAGLGFEVGHGLAVRILGEDEETKEAVFSAPLPIKVSKLSFGLALGYDKIYSVIIMDREEDIMMLTKGDRVVGKDIDFQGYVRSGSVDDSLHRESIKSKTTNAAPKVLSVSDSYMLCDFSMYGGTIGPDLEAIKTNYGPDVTPEQVLDGTVMPPEAFEPVAAYIVAELMTAPKKH